MHVKLGRIKVYLCFGPPRPWLELTHFMSELYMFCLIYVPVFKKEGNFKQILSLICKNVFKSESDVHLLILFSQDFVIVKRGTIEYDEQLLINM